MNNGYVPLSVTDALHEDGSVAHTGVRLETEKCSPAAGHQSPKLIEYPRMSINVGAVHLETALNVTAQLPVGVSCLPQVHVLDVGGCENLRKLGFGKASSPGDRQLSNIDDTLNTGLLESRYELGNSPALVPYGEQAALRPE